MIEQTRLRDIQWTCANSRVHCDAVFPCFDPAGQVRMLLVATDQWGWLIAPAGRARIVLGDVAFDGPLEDLYKVSDRAIGPLDGLFLFDPWWLARLAGSGLTESQVSAVVRANLAARADSGQPVNSVWFDDALSQVDRVEVGGSLWRRSLSGAALRAWLVEGQPPYSPEKKGTVLLQEGEQKGDGPLYEPTDGPLKRVAADRRVGGGRVVIGQPSANPDRPLTAGVKEIVGRPTPVRPPPRPATAASASRPRPPEAPLEVRKTPGRPQRPSQPPVPPQARPPVHRPKVEEAPGLRLPAEVEAEEVALSAVGSSREIELPPAEVPIAEIDEPAPPPAAPPPVARPPRRPTRARREADQQDEVAKALDRIRQQIRRRGR